MIIKIEKSVQNSFSFLLHEKRKSHGKVLRNVIILNIIANNKKYTKPKSMKR